MDYVVYSNRHEISLKDIVIGDFEEVRRFETEVEGVSVLGISVSLPRFSRLITIGIVKLEINKNLKIVNWIRPLTATQRALKPKVSIIDAIVDESAVTMQIEPSPIQMVVKSILLEDEGENSEILLPAPDSACMKTFLQQFHQSFSDINLGLCSLKVQSFDTSEPCAENETQIGILVEIQRLLEITNQPSILLIETPTINSLDNKKRATSSIQCLVNLSCFLESSFAGTESTRQREFDNRELNEDKTQNTLDKEIKRKLSIDFECSLIANSIPNNSVNKYASLQGKPRRYLSRPVNLATTYENRISGLKINQFKNLIGSNLKNELPKIRVCCSCIYPAALAVLISLQEKLHDRVFIELDWSNSIELIEALGRGNEFDFVVAAEDPFMTVATGRAFDYAKLTELQYSPQYLLVKKQFLDEEPKQILIVQGSSAVNQFWSLKNEQGLNADGKFLESAKRLSSYAQSLEKGQGIIAWAPMAKNIADAHNLTTRPGWGMISSFLSGVTNLNGIKERKLENLRHHSKTPLSQNGLN